MFEFRSFTVNGLHGDKTVGLTFFKNSLILVGENGTGKSTIANLLFYLLTGQLTRMLEHPFSGVEVRFSSCEFAFAREEIEAALEKDGSSRISQLDRLLMSLGPEYLVQNPSKIAELADSFGVSPLRIENRVHNLLQLRLEFEMDANSPVVERLKEVRKAFPYKVLFLPTFRRIELELGKLLPKLVERHGDESLQRMRRERSGKGHLELVEFGMSDVKQAIQAKMKELNDGLTEDLRTLMGTYLKDVISGQHAPAAESIINLTENDIASIFGRLKDEILSDHERGKLRETINTIKKKGKLTPQTKAVALFLTRLIDLHKARQDAERPVRAFVEVCNEYLKGGKKLSYDGGVGRLILLQTNTQQQLEYSVLSSGEKQIVSLFTHLYLSTNDKIFIIIDEPELSLSVPWQERFLPDILKTDRCAGLFAVTHSPYIFNNGLIDSTHSIGDFTIYE